MENIVTLLSIISGFVLGWIAHTKVYNSQLQANTKAAEQMKESFAVIAQDSLAKNNQQFLDLAKMNLEKVQVSADKDLKNRQDAIQNFANNLQQNLQRYERLVTSFEQDRDKKYGALKEQLDYIIQAEKNLRETTRTLETALKDSKARGNWGELQLKRVIEMAGLTEHVDFSTQTTVTVDSQMFRPDVIVKMPDVRNIAIDAKAPLANYLKATAAKDNETKIKHLKTFLQDMKRHISDLGSKSYFDKIENSAPFVVMFLPGESLIRAAMELDVNLLDEALSKKVIIASPSTLLAILLIVEKSWKDSKVSTHLESVKKEGQELIKRLDTFVSHLEKVGKGLTSAANAFNSLAGSWNRNLIPQTLKFNKLRGHKTPVQELSQANIPDQKEFVRLQQENLLNE